MAIEKETIVTNNITNSVQKSSYYSNLPVEAKNIFNDALQETLVKSAPESVQKVVSTSTAAFNFIPDNLVGPTNPLNITSSNLSVSGLKGKLDNFVGDGIRSDLTNQIVNDLASKFSSKLPDGLKGVLSISGLGTDLTSSIAYGVKNNVDSLLGSFSTNTLSGKVVPVVKDVDGILQREGLAGANKAYDESAYRSALSQAKQFDINNTENKEKLVTQTFGFIDPSATYPTKEYSGRPETNKLTQGDVKGTIVQSKEKDRLKGIQLPNGQSWEQPKIPFKGEYPYNKVIQTEGGHIIEMDDTPGSERLQVYHASGTFVEIDVSGSIVKRTKGSSYEIIDKNGYISVTGDASVSVKGSIKIFVGGDADIEVEGDTNVKCMNDITMQAAGRVDISATEEINLHSANINIEADVNLKVLSDGASYYASGSTMHMKANSTIYQQTTAGFNLLTGSDINIDSSQNIWLNSGKASSATFSNTSNIGLIGPRKDIVYETIADPVVPNYLDKYTLVTEDAEIQEEANKQAINLEQLGVASESELQSKGIPLRSITPSSGVLEIVKPDPSLLQQTYLPDNYKLSPNFTLAQLSSKAVVSNYPVVAQLGLSYGQLVYNLQGIALNVLETVLKLYPNMFVTSAFRTAKSSSTTSDHPRGKAVDIQFKNVSKSDYYEIANKLATNLKYDKLLLEYKTYGTGLPWIHISFDVNNPRGIVLTYLNDKKYGNGLVDLA